MKTKKSKTDWMRINAMVAAVCVGVTCVISVYVGEAFQALSLLVIFGFILYSEEDWVRLIKQNELTEEALNTASRAIEGWAKAHELNRELRSELEKLGYNDSTHTN